MSCPLFLPASPLAGFASEASSLGDFYGGECAVQPAALIPVDTLRRCCNAGYGRTACEHAAQSDADAFRFLIKSRNEGVVQVAWSSERNHHPVAVGTLSVSGPGDSADPLERQARAFASAYFRQNRI
jgi:hypothetical protein